MDGGGIVCSFSYALITNCLISDNVAHQGYGGGIDCGRGAPVLVNCTIVRNTAQVFAGGLIGGRSSESMTNCVLMSNVPNSVELGTGPFSVTYCLVEGGLPGEGNFDAFLGRNVDAGNTGNG